MSVSNHLQPAKTSDQSLLKIAWLYIGLMLWVALSCHIPIAPANDILYEFSSLILALLPLILGVPVRKNKIKKDPQSMFSVVPLWVKGFLLILCAVTIMNAFALSLRFLLPDTASTSVGAIFINTSIFFLKWGGFGIMAFGQYTLRRQEILVTETHSNKMKSKIMSSLIFVLATTTIVYFIWKDVSAMTAGWF